MAKITRYDGNFKAFGSDATGTERTVFGSTAQTDDLTTNLGAEYQRGWGVLPSGQKPPKQYFNGALFGTSQAVAYLHQAGVAEWNGEQEYHAGSITNRNGQIFVCLKNDHVSASAPETDSTNWRLDDGSVATISALLNRTTVGTVNVLNYHTGLEGGGGVFYWDASKPKTEHNGGTVIDPTVTFPSDWNNQTQLTDWFTAGTGTGCWVRQYDGAVNVRWFGAKGDGITDDSASIQSALSASSDVYIPSGTYSIASNISVVNKSLVGSPARGSSKIKIVGDYSVQTGGLYRLQHLSIYNSAKTGNLINQIASGDRTAYIKDCVLTSAVRCINIDGYFNYSNIFENIEFADFTDIGFYFNSPGSTGNVYTNLYFTNWSAYPTTKNTARAFMWFDGPIDESSFRQINFEWGKITNSCFVINGLINASFDCVHIEGVELNAGTEVFNIIDNGYGARINIKNVSLKSCTLLGNETKIVTVSNTLNNDLNVDIENFTAIDSIKGSTTNHRVAYRSGTIGTNTPKIRIRDFKSDITGANNFLPIEATTYRPVLLEMNDVLYYQEKAGITYMGASPSIPASGVYPIKALVYNSSVTSSSDIGWISYRKGDFSNPQHGNITVTQYSSAATVDATAYSYFGIGDYILVGTQTVRINNKYGGSTFDVDNISVASGTYACKVASPAFRAI